MYSGKFNLQDMTKISMFVALCCVTAFIAFPLPFTPGLVTALTLTMSLSAYVLTPRQTFIVIILLFGCKIMLHLPKCCGNIIP